MPGCAPTGPRTAQAPGSWAGTQYETLLDNAAPTTEIHDTCLAVSLDMSRARRAIKAEGGGVGGAASVLRRELDTIAAALRAAEVAAGSAGSGADELALHAPFSPTTPTAKLDRPPDVGRNLATAGPVAVREHLDHLRTDTGLHSVYWISEWPRSEVHPGFLSPLLLAAGVRRTTSIVAQPLTTAEAMRAVRKARVEYQTDAAHRERIGQLNDAGADQEWADVTQRERDLVAGHGDLRYAGFVVVTAPDLDALAGRTRRRRAGRRSRPVARPACCSVNRRRPSRPPRCHYAGGSEIAHPEARLLDVRSDTKARARADRAAFALDRPDPIDEPTYLPRSASRARTRCAPGCGSRSPRTPRRPPRSPAPTRSSPKPGSAPTGCSSARTCSPAARSSSTRGCSTSRAS